MEGRGRLSFVNLEQNNRIKETGLKGSELWPWLQAGPGHFLRPGKCGSSPSVGLHRPARDPPSCALGPYACLDGWGVRALGLEVCGPSQITACGGGGNRAGRAPGQGGCLAGTPVVRWTDPVGTEAALPGGTLTEQRQAGELQTGLGAISRAQLPLIAPSVWV